jgi:glutamyl-tRNA synthetase
MSKKVRVRFAPSPTGPLHIGGVRTALFNYLFAKQCGGVFILRIEDTDQNRYVEGAEAYIVETLNWLNIPFDEGIGKEGLYGPYRQSERKKMYQQYAEQLISKGKAYYAFDTNDELNFHRKDHEKKGKTFIYNWHNREKLTNSISLTKEEVKKKIANGEDYVVRFKMYDPNQNMEEEVVAEDLIRGNVSFKKALLDDKVLFKQDGMPTYHLANIVDDHFMEISHVIRGEEWLPSVPLHIELYKALNWEIPKFAHLPLIMKPVGKGKLSKRDGDKMGFPVFPIQWNSNNGEVFSGYREDGYFSEAVINMLALLGWNPGTEQEIFNLDELIKSFSLARVNKAGARFDPEKTKWFQHHYLQEKNNESLSALFTNLLIKKGIDHNKNLEKIIGLIKERSSFVADFWEQGSYFFEAPITYNEKAIKKAFKEKTPQLLSNLVVLLEECVDFSSENLTNKTKSWITENDIGFGNVMMPLRLALVGEMKGPDVFEIAEILGKKEVISRINKAIAFLY